SPGGKKDSMTKNRITPDLRSFVAYASEKFCCPVVCRLRSFYLPYSCLFPTGGNGQPEKSDRQGGK
ncbi:MAG TPA: hypothetical protein VFU15_13870, partial [Bacteroidia bacterium]|nr:hypothetical protein [Bacteroidia bacterium]